MANNNAPFGLRHRSNVGGAAPNYSVIAMTIDKDDTAPIGQGDPVRQLNTGYITAWTAGTSVVALAGVLDGVEYLDNNGNYRRSPNWPGSGAQQDLIAHVIPAYNESATFLIQSSGSAITLADIGLNGDFVVGTPNARTGQSTTSLNQATLATTATFPVKIIGLYNGVGDGSDAASSHNWVVVKFNSNAVLGV
jgi:hypothetical protein